MSAWYEDREELAMFARIFHALGGFEASDGDSAENLLDYLEKPWKWTEEHARWRALGRPDEEHVEIGQLLGDVAVGTEDG